MCSTPRASGSMRKVHRLPTSRAHFKSYAQMMRSASEMYDKKQEKQAEQQQQDNSHDDSSKETVYIQQSLDKTISVMKNDSTNQNSALESISRFIALIRSKIPPIVTT